MLPFHYCTTAHAAYNWDGFPRSAIAPEKSCTIMPQQMARWIGFILIAALIPTLATFSLSVKRFIALQRLYDIRAEGKCETGVSTEPSEKPPLREPSPLEFLAFRPEPDKQLVRGCRVPVFAKLAVRPPHERVLVPPIRSGGPRLERVVTQCRCVATSLMVVAPPVRGHAPPAALENSGANTRSICF